MDRRPRASRWPPAKRCEYVKADGEQCKRWALRMGRWCPFHNANPKYAENRRQEAQEVRVVAEVVQTVLGAVALAKQDIEQAAPEAVATLLRVMRDPESPASARVRSAEILLKAAGALGVDVHVEVATSGQSAVEVIKERLAALRPALD